MCAIGDLTRLCSYRVLYVANLDCKRMQWSLNNNTSVGESFAAEKRGGKVSGCGWEYDAVCAACSAASAASQPSAAARPRRGVTRFSVRFQTEFFLSSPFVGRPCWQHSGNVRRVDWYRLERNTIIATKPCLHGHFRS